MVPASRIAVTAHQRTLLTALVLALLALLFLRFNCGLMPTEAEPTFSNVDASIRVDA